MTRLVISLALGVAVPQTVLAQESTGPASARHVRVNGVELSYLDQGRGIPVVFVHGSLEGIRAPTLLLSGERTLPLNKLIDARLESLLPHRERIVVALASHEMWSEKPEECRKAALAFLAAH